MKRAVKLANLPLYNIYSCAYVHYYCRTIDMDIDILHFNLLGHTHGASFRLDRAQNNGRSMDNVRPDWGFYRSNVRLAGHVDRTRWLVTFIVIL